MEVRRALGAARRRLRPARIRLSPPVPAPRARRLRAGYGSLAMSVRGYIDNVVLVSRAQPVRAANELAELFPAATIHLITLSRLAQERVPLLHERVRHVHGPDHLARAEYLCRVPQPQLIIEVGGDATRMVNRFWHLFDFLAAGGVYVLDHRPRDPSASPDSAPLEKFRSLASTGEGWSRELRESCGWVEFRDDLVLVGKRVEHRIKLRDERATEILTTRYGTPWGEVVSTRPPLSFVPPVDVATHGDRGSWHGQTQTGPDTTGIDVPQLSLRRYTDVVCRHMQRLARDNYWLPDTFRHPWDRELRHRKLVRASAWHARLPDDAPATPSRHLDGAFFYLDTEYPAHYGHVLSEVVSRYWGWKHAAAIEPDLRPLVSRSHKGSGEIPDFQRQVFEALGIDVRRIEYIERDEAVAVDVLYAATPMFSMPKYASPELREPWTMIRDAVYLPDLTTPTRLFVTRPAKPIRSCLNSDDVESFFKELGFEIFNPEDHDFAVQVTNFANAEVIAGLSGSNMMTAMFAPEKTIIAITADTFGANNEFLIGAVVGAHLHNVIGDAAIKHPHGRWTWAAYQSNFTVDLDRLGPGIRAALG